MYWKRRFFENIAGTSSNPLAFDLSHAKGSFLFNKNGEAFLDLTSGFSVCNLGHGNPKVMEAIQLQVSQFMHTTVYGEHIQNVQTQLANILCQTLPHHLNNVYFLNTGSETVDAMIKLSRILTGKSKIIVCKNAYHGSTIGAESLRSDINTRGIFYPLLPDIHFIEYGNIKDLEELDEETALIIMETFQAEAGVRIASAEYFYTLNDVCKQKKILIALDEIQTGIGRTGKMFAFQHTALMPDFILCGKALGGGLPLAAIIGSAKNLHYFSTDPPLSYITTFGGNPVCCAAGLASLQYLLENKIIEKLEENFSFITSKLNHRLITDVRGKGLFIAIEFHPDINTSHIIRKMFSNKIIIDGFLFDKNSLRFMPALDTKLEDIIHSIDLLLSI